MTSDEMDPLCTWPIFHSKLVSRQEVAERTLAFQFEKPPGWTFKAGQFVDLTLVSPPETDAEGDKRGFSIASAPEEATLMVASRMRDTAFKRSLQAVPLGTSVTIEGPFGSLNLHNNAARTAVILAGGIGITPFRSILVAAAKRKLPQQIFVFSSNRRPEDAPFLDELIALQGENPRYKLIATMTEMAKSHRSWNGETGMIDQALLARHLKDAASPIYYIAGPPAMVKGLHMMLNGAGVDDDDIRTEEFAGY
jgi:ferredoxin-NADP reductase